MTQRIFLATILLSGLSSSLFAQTKRTVEFNRDIRPILSDNCFVCHGPDNNLRKANLRLDVDKGLFDEKEGVRILVAGKPQDSELYKRLTHEKRSERMPPAKTKKELTRDQVELVRLWIEQGAKYQGHWSLTAPVKVPLPEVKHTPGNAIDHFILARLERDGLAPSKEADRRTLIRRLSFDLIGLPPTPAQVDEFLKDNSPTAYEKLVDRLLASPHFGERMALYWLDLVRYADTGGYHSDNHRDVYLYRDWVINAFNANKPFDQFTTEQLAGDLLPKSTMEQKIASGYNRLLQTTEEGGAQAKEYQAKYYADRVRNVSTVWLGLTLGCCECHDHKFDPFSSKEFYSFEAFFADLQEVSVGRQPQTTINKKEATLISISGPPRIVRVLPRGNWLDESGAIVQPATPASLPALGVTGRRATRLDLAQWLMSKDNPLTSRVFVNRLWMLYFGQGLVKTLDDFGAQGAWPTHPELLDWLAVEFMQPSTPAGFGAPHSAAWDVKHMIKLMVTSSTYRQAATASDSLKQRDPYNLLCARQFPHRLEAELIRDNALAVSGLLSSKIGGPSTKPYQPAGYWSFLNFPTRDWQKDTGENQYRRGLYTYWQRTFLHPSLLAFDASTREECSVERPRSNTPQQALVLLNDPTYVEAARVFAQRILQKGGDTKENKIAYAIREALQRPARRDEVIILAALYDKHLAQYRADAAAAKALLQVGDSPIPAELPAAELAAWTNVTRVILNLHESITRN